MNQIIKKPIEDNRSIEEKVEELKQLTRREMQELKVPGVAVGLNVKGVDYCFGCGITNIENPLEVTPRTLFEIGSTTKTITATVIMILVEQSKLNLDDKLRKYLPDFKVQDEYTAANVTIRQLLNHTAGWEGDIFTSTGSGNDALKIYVSKLANIAQQTPLGEVYAYNNTSFNILGRLIEVITGKPYEAVVREMVLRPLEMANSCFFLGKILLQRFAAGHLINGDTMIIVKPAEEGRSCNPCGGLFSSANDQMKYARFQMSDGCTVTGKRLLSEETMRVMQTPTFSAEGDGKIGLAWQLKEIDGIKFVSHGGCCIGQQSDFWMAPDGQIAMTVLTNQDDGYILHKKLSNWVKEHFLGVVESTPVPLSPGSMDLAPYIGDYMLSSTGDIFTLSAKDGRMIIIHAKGKYSALFDMVPAPYQPMHAAFYKPDRFILLNDSFKDIRGEFIRSKEGRIAWMRLGNNVLAKQ